MGKFHLEKFVKYDANSNKSMCVISSCRRLLAGKSKSNITRHYKLIHKININSDNECDNEESSFSMSNIHETNINSDNESDNDECSSPKKHKVETKLTTTMDKNDFLKCCVGLITKKNFPFSIFDDDELFKKIIEPYEEKFNINLNSSNIGSVLENATAHIKHKIAAAIRNKMFCLKIDVASRMERSVLGVNIQYIKDNKICINTIGMIQTTNRDTAANLKEEILNCLDEYNINIQQIYSNTTDNGANVLKLSKLLEEMQHASVEIEENDIDISTTTQIESKLESVFSGIRCAAHTVQLAASDVINTIGHEIEGCRRLTKKLRTLVRSGNKEISLPCLDIRTRWLSTYSMVNDILSLRDFVDSENIVEIDWLFVEDFVTAFQPLAKCTLKLQEEQYILGDFFRDWLLCELELEELVQINSFAVDLLNAMHNRKEALLNYGAFAAALYLDPRFNFVGTPFLNDQLKQIALNHLLKTNDMANKLKDLPSEQDPLVNTSTSTYNIPDDNATKSANPYEKLDLHVQAMKIHRQSFTINIRETIQHKLMKLEEKERVPFDTNVLEHWQKLYGRDVEMMQLANIALAVPATQVTVERAFSALSMILTKVHSKMSKKSLSNVFITKLNCGLFDYSEFPLLD